MPDTSLDRLVLSLRRAGWTTPVIARACKSVPSHDLDIAIHRADFFLSVQALIGAFREEMKSLYELRANLAAFEKERKANLAKLDEITQGFKKPDIQPLY